jgi:2-polyprenyl-3-methyl-5-hydroxy-6-metoxy-1,4-benzoquinol methylase
MSGQKRQADSAHEAGRNYLKVVYEEGQRPQSGYPDNLAARLMDLAGLRSGMRLLDAGCGRGEMLAAFARRGLVCEGLDLAEGASCPHPGVGVSQADIFGGAWPCADAQYDAVFLKSVLEHVMDPSHMLAECKRVLKPGGALIVLTPDFASTMPVFYEDPTHVHPYVPMSLRALFAMHGFAQGRAERFCHHERIWEGGLAKLLADLCWLVLSVPAARALAQATGLKFIKWAVERQVLGICRRP